MFPCCQKAPLQLKNIPLTSTFHNADHPVQLLWLTGVKKPVIYHNADQSALLEFVHVHVTCGVMPISMLYGKVRCNNTGIIIMPTAIK